MPAPRRAAAVAVLGAVPLAVGALGAGRASAHGSLGDPVGRVAQCCAEGPESPDPAACRAAGAGAALAETGGDGSTPYIAVGGAAALFASVRRRASRAR